MTSIWHRWNAWSYRHGYRLGVRLARLIIRDARLGSPDDVCPTCGGDHYDWSACEGRHA